MVILWALLVLCHSSLFVLSTESITFHLKAIKYFCIQNKINEPAPYLIDGFFLFFLFQILEQEAFSCIWCKVLLVSNLCFAFEMTALKDNIESFIISAILIYLKTEVMSSKNLARRVVIPIKRTKRYFSLLKCHDSILCQDSF